MSGGPIATSRGGPPPCNLHWRRGATTDRGIAPGAALALRPLGNDPELLHGLLHGAPKSSRKTCA
eukprot:9873838-Lingulodinium_polyedra.AAC.1